MSNAGRRLLISSNTCGTYESPDDEAWCRLWAAPSAGVPVPSLLKRYFAASYISTLDPTTGLCGGPVRVVARACATDCDYVYYGTHGEADFGWGCCYRVLQMLAGALVRRGWLCTPNSKPVSSQVCAHEAIFPTIQSIQEALVRVGRLDDDRVGSRDWIEPPDVAAVLRSLGVECLESTINGRAALDLAQLDDLLWRHFSDGGPQTPVAIDDKTYTYAITGICEVSAEHATLDMPKYVPPICATHWVCVFDPHARGDITFNDFATGQAHRFSSASPLRPPGCARWIPFGTLFSSGAGPGCWMVALPTGCNAT